MTNYIVNLNSDLVLVGIAVAYGYYITIIKKKRR